MKRTSAAAIAAILVLAAPALTGCFSGKGATTSMQATMNSGNGVDAVAGPLHIENATLVQGPDGSQAVTLTTRIVNLGPESDMLTGVSINGAAATITEGKNELPGGSSVSFGYDSDRWINGYGQDIATATYVPVVLTFQNAGIVNMSVMAVPPVGYYEGIAPNPATAAMPAASGAAVDSVDQPSE